MEQEYPVPGYEGYFATESGDIISYKGKHRKVLKPALSRSYRARASALSCQLYNSKNKTGKTYKVVRVVLSAKLGRALEHWEQACHIDGNRTNNRMDNLQVGCFVNNAIDCLENGKRQSSVEQIKRAIKRLKGILKTLDK